ncbi:MAG: DMT family transporter [Alphaproteobacteria bacterium]|nr:DMT family transporter [Alphaproteobacteria bacterium]
MTLPAPTAMPVQRSDALRAVLFTCLAYGLFNICDVAIKYTAERYHTAQVLFINAVFIILLLGGYGLVRDRKRAFRTKKFKLMTMHALLAQVAGVCNVLAFPHMQLTMFYTLVFTSPLWVALLSIVFMKDKAEPRRLMAIVAGLGIVVLTLRPGGGMDMWSLLVLLGSFAYSVQLLIMRRIGRDESRLFMVMYGAVVTLLVTAPFLPGNFKVPEMFDWSMFLLGAAAAAGGLLTVSYAFQIAPSPSVVAPYHYTQIVWGAILGYLVFGDVPDTHVIAGAVGLIMAGAYLIYDETRRPVLKLGA